jgi:AcrR family transcriptional regulator
MCNNFGMSRKYELKARAERQRETRQRIVEAAVQLHRTKGPARTSFSDVARLAGVQRHTLYRHFPDERELLLACSGHFGELHPPPDVSAWDSIADPAERLRRGLGELYEWFEATEDMMASILRDAEVDPLIREIVQMRRAGPAARIREVLARGIRGKRRLAALELALDFNAWRRLAAAGLPPAEAAETMVAAVFAQEGGRHA